MQPGPQWPAIVVRAGRIAFLYRFHADERGQTEEVFVEVGILQAQVSFVGILVVFQERRLDEKLTCPVDNLLRLVQPVQADSYLDLV